MSENMKIVRGVLIFETVFLVSVYLLSVFADVQLQMGTIMFAAIFIPAILFGSAIGRRRKK